MIRENKPILDEFNATYWHSKGYTGKGITVAMLDDNGGILSHMKSYCVDVLNTGKGHGHATNVAQTLHAFAPGVRILMFDNKFHKNEAYEWIKKHKDEIDVINVSQAGKGGLPTSDFNRYEALGIPLICASGNDGYENRISYPAALPWTIAIGAWNWRDKGVRARDVAEYSNSGAELDAVSPTEIYVLNEYGTYAYNNSGTSYAAPSAIGMLSCYLQLRKEKGLPKITTEEARKFIHDNCQDIREKGFDFASGFGLFKLPNFIPTTMPKPPTESKPEQPVKPVVPNKPKEDITKEDIIEMVKQTFKDVTPQNSAFTAIESIHEKGIVGGYSDGTFKPNDPVTRKQMAVMLDKTIEYILNQLK